MFHVETKIMATISITTEQRSDVEHKLETTIELLDRALKNKHGYTEVPSLCPILAEYILAIALAETLEKDEFSLGPLVERVICFGVAYGKTQYQPLCSRAQP